MIDFFDRYYCSLQDKNKYFTSLRIYSILRFSIRFIANFILPIYFRLTKNKKQYSFVPNNKIGSRVIVSLTSYPARINRLWLVIESIFRQTRKPDKIILYLSRIQFPDENLLPKSLLRQKGRGLEIRFVDNNYNSHKKYIYTLTDFADDFLLTIDDDIFYRSNMIEQLYKTSLLFPFAVIAQYCTQIKWKDDKELIQYSLWPKIEEEKDAGFDVFFGSGGGAIFPPHSLHPDVVNSKLFNDLCPTADDIWLNAMCRLNNTKVKYIQGTSSFLPVLNFNDTALSLINNDMNQNDIQIQRTRDYYKNCDPFKFQSNKNCKLDIDINE